MQIDRAMRLVTMQEDRDRSDRYMGYQQRDRDNAPPGQVENAIE